MNHQAIDDDHDPSLDKPEREKKKFPPIQLQDQREAPEWTCPDCRKDALFCEHAGTGTPQAAAPSNNAEREKTMVWAMKYSHLQSPDREQETDNFMGMTIHELRQIKETLVLLDNPGLSAQLRDYIDQSIRLIVREIKLKEIDPRK